MNELLKQHSELLMNQSIQAVLPDQAVRNALKNIHFNSGKIIMIAIGKAGWLMGKTAADCVDIDEGLVVTKYHHSKGEINKTEIIEAGHPILDENSIRGAEKALQLVRNLNENDNVLFLVSGGGSALFESPLISLEELQNINSQLLKCGASIEEINTVRKRLSKVKGGKFAQACKPAKVFSIILSDVIGDDISMIASGPTCNDSSSLQDCLDIIEKYKLVINPQTLDIIKSQSDVEITNSEHYMAGNNSLLISSAKQTAQSLGYSVITLNKPLVGDVSDAIEMFKQLAEKYKNTKTAIIAGGELTVKVKGTGLGGRAMQFALCLGKDLPDGCSAFAFGSDGTDGPTDAAGGYFDNTMTFDGLQNYIDNNDSYHALQMTDGLLISGPTGTNVNDLYCLLCDGENKIQLTIDVPSQEESLIDYGKTFCVNGTIKAPHEFAKDDKLEILLKNESGDAVRHCSNIYQNNKNIWTYHPDLTCYSEEIDPGRKGMLEYGFAELMVDDVNNPQLSYRNATNKCLFNQTSFKSIIVSATDQRHGAIFDDGINYTDENGNPYTTLPMGNYSIEVSLKTKDESLLAGCNTDIVIGKHKETTIVRFNPVSHRENMTKWAKENGFTIINDPVSGYLNPYTGDWYYHMGLLTMYRANDITIYHNARANMFVYLDEANSTSIATELAYMQTQRLIENPERMRYFHYDIGETDVCGHNANIIEFNNYMDLCRFDIVNSTAKENFYMLKKQALISTQFDTADLSVKKDERFAVMGVLKPYQLDEKYFTLKKDNTYIITNGYGLIRYTFVKDDKEIVIDRQLGLERYTDHSIGSSILEFYNIFNTSLFEVGQYKVKISALDFYGCNTVANSEFMLNITE